MSMSISRLINSDNNPNNSRNTQWRSVTQTVMELGNYVNHSKLVIVRAGQHLLFNTDIYVAVNSSERFPKFPVLSIDYRECRFIFGDQDYSHSKKNCFGL